MLKKRFIHLKILFFLFLPLLINFNVHALNKDKPIVDKNKIWIIRFNQNIGFDSLSNDTIYVTNNYGNKEKIKLIPGPYTNTVRVLPPDSGYRDNTDYILTITKQLCSLENKQLKENKKFYFKTKEKSEETVVFKDPILDANIRGEIKKSLYEPIYKSEVENITKLYLSNCNIKDISGLDSLVNLESIDLSKNQIKDISPLKNLGNLEYLFLYDNQISDITPLKDLTNIKAVYLYKNQINDVTSLKKLTSLKILSLEYNQIQDASPLQNLKNLQQLMLSGNLIGEEQEKSLRVSLPNCDISYN